MAKKPDASMTMSAEDAKAQAVLKMNEWIETVDSAERMHVGTWFEIPKGYEQWHFIRCGVRNNDRALALASQLKRMGYQDAPKGVRCAGFEGDGVDGLYVCVPNEAWLVLKERKRRASKTVDEQIQESIGGHMSALQSQLGPGSQVSFSGSTRSGSVADIAEHIRSGG